MPQQDELKLLQLKVPDASRIASLTRFRPSQMTEHHNLVDEKPVVWPKRGNHRLLPFIRRGQSLGSRCVTCGRQVYGMPDAGLIGAAIGGDAIAEACIRKPNVSIKDTTKVKTRGHR